MFAKQALCKPSPRGQTAQILKQTATSWGKVSSVAVVIALDPPLLLCLAPQLPSTPNPSPYLLQCKASLGWSAFFLIFSGCQNPSCQIQVNRPKTQMSVLDWVSQADWTCSEQLLRSKLVPLPRPGCSALSHSLPVASPAPVCVSITFHAHWMSQSTACNIPGCNLSGTKARTSWHIHLVWCSAQGIKDFSATVLERPEAGGFKVCRKVV